MVGYETVIANIPRPDWKDKDIIDVQQTQDIINDLVYCFKKYNPQAKQVAKNFGTGYIGTDAKNIWAFIKDNIKYEAEPEKQQTTASFSRIIHDKLGDCKHSALLASSIAWNLGYNIIFRFVAYDRGTTYGHVYTLIENPKTGRKFVIDPLQPFNTEKFYYKKVDYKATNNLKSDPMLTRMTGVQTNTPANAAVTMGRHHAHHNKHKRRPYIHPDETRMVVGAMEIIMSPSIAGDQADILDGLCGIGKRSKAQRQEHRKETKATRVKKREARGGSRLKKISLAPVRAAFSSLLMVNARGLATGMAHSLKANENEVKKMAAKLGYKFENLKKQVLHGATKKPLLGSKLHGVVHEMDGIGVVITAAAFTAAAPAILLAIAMFKSLGIKAPGNTGDLATEATEALASGGTNISVDSGGGGSSSPSNSDSGSYSPPPSTYGGGSGGDGGGTSEVATQHQEEGKDAAGNDEPFYIKYKTPLLVVGAGVVAYIANKKYKFI